MASPQVQEVEARRAGNGAVTVGREVEHRKHRTTGLPHIEQGFAYVDGKRMALAPGDPDIALLQKIRSARNISWGFGPVTVTLDADVSAMTCWVTVSLFGVELAEFEVNRDKACVNAGGGALGVSAELDTCLLFDPLAIRLTGEVCYIFGCDGFDEIIYL